MFDVRSLGDGLLQKREALVQRLAHAGDGFQERAQLRLWGRAAFPSGLPQSFVFYQVAPIKSPIVDFGT